MTPIVENIAIWQNSTNECYNRPALNYAGFLSADEKAKLERIRQGRMLYDGLHREYFLGENRTQFNFPQMQVSGNITRPYITFNLLKLVCHKTADLLFGEEPLLRVDDEIQQEKLFDLVDRSSLLALFYDCAVEACYEAESFLEACVKDGKVYLRRIPADEIFCTGAFQPDRQFSKYVRYALQNRGTAEKPIWILLETWYLAGSIERHLWQLDHNGMKLPRELALDQWKLEEGEAPLVGLQPTGIDRNTVTWIPGQLARDKAVARIDGLIELQDALNAKETQLSRVLAKHADPKVAFPQEMADPQGNVPAGHDAMYYSEPDRIPKYIAPELEYDAAHKDRAFCVNALLIAAEIAPDLMGLKEGAAPDAARKLRLAATNTLSMVKRIGKNWKSGIRRAIGVAQDLENTLPGERYDRKPISAEMRDGIPIDELDQANAIATLRACKSMSRRRSVSLQIPDPAGQEEEMEELEEEDAAAMPATLFGEPASAGEKKPEPEQTNAA